MAQARGEELHSLHAKLAEVREVMSFQTVEAETHLEVSLRSVVQSQHDPMIRSEL